MSHYRKQFLYILGSVLLLLCAAPLQAADADLILKNGRIWTGDPENPWAEAIAIRRSRIVAVGNNLPVAQLAGPNSHVIDLGGRLAVPGFNDAHTHFVTNSLNMAGVDLSGDCSVAAMQKAVKDWAAAHPKEIWITGSGWRYECFSAHQLPARQDLDAVVRDRPVFLRSWDGHAAWVNSKALQLAGVGAHTRYTGSGQLGVDPKTGEPTGYLKEGARALVEKTIPETSREKKLAALEQGLKLAASMGITSIQNAGGDSETLALFDELEKQRKLTARVNVALTVSPSMQDDSVDHLLELKQNFHSFRVRAGAVKFVLDGSVESHTAAMLAPYSDGSGSAKIAWTPEAYNAMVTLADSGGFQVFTHASGDKAVRMALDAYEDARKANGSHDARFRIEQIEAIAPADLARFSRLGVLASVQPVRADPAMADLWSKALGPERLKLVFPWRSLEQAGARLVFSSDCPAMMRCDPIRGISAAVTRETPDGKPAGGWMAGQRVSVESAVRAFTVNGAYASFEDRMKGKLKAGMLADVAVLSQDIFSIPPEEIYKTKVDLTIFDGQVIYTRQ